MRFGEVLGGGRSRGSRWEARQVLRLYSSVSNTEPWECGKVTVPLKLLWISGWWRSIEREVHQKLKLHLGVNTKS